MAKTTVMELSELGQSIWMDSISRSMIETGELQEMIDKGVMGMTSNPTIFDQAISTGTDYDEKIRELHGSGKSTFEVYDELTVKDIQDAADLFKPVYEKTDGLDGYVSLEINPKLAAMTAKTIQEGKRLHSKVNRPNVMFKVPATDEGFEAIEELLAEGINVNITLIFSLQQYIKTAQSFLKGMKRFLDKGGDLSRMASVASVFVSRVDTAIDKMLDGMGTEKAGSLKGKAAVSNSKLIFKKYQEIFSGSDFQELKDKGARVQRVLWGSTGTKDPSYSDIKYVTELIGNPTVNTVPRKTYDAFLDHGIVKESLSHDVKSAEEAIAALSESGISVDAVCEKLLADGVVSFEKSFDSLLSTIEKKANT